MIIEQDQFEKPKQCRSFVGRRCFIFFTITASVLIAGAGAFLYWLRMSPGASFALLKIAAASDIGFIASPVIDQDNLWQSISEELTPALLNSPTPEQEAKLTPLEQSQRLVMKNTVAKLLPTVINSMMTVRSLNKDSSQNNPTNTFEATALPMMLRVSPDIWTQWIEELRRGEFSLGECQSAGDRAACELIIHGPLKQSVTLALLWEKQSWFWQLRGIAGVDRLLAAMRNTPKIP